MCSSDSKDIPYAMTRAEILRLVRKHRPMNPFIIAIILPIIGSTILFFSCALMQITGNTPDCLKPTAEEGTSAAGINSVDHKPKNASAEAFLEERP
jgi:hypothetical protein